MVLSIAEYYARLRRIHEITLDFRYGQRSVDILWRPAIWAPRGVPFAAEHPHVSDDGIPADMLWRRQVEATVRNGDPHGVWTPNPILVYTETPWFICKGAETVSMNVDDDLLPVTADIPDVLAALDDLIGDLLQITADVRDARAARQRPVAACDGPDERVIAALRAYRARRCPARKV